MWSKNKEVWYRKCHFPGEIQQAIADCRQDLKALNLSRSRQGLPWFTLVRPPRQTAVVNILGTHFAVTAKILIGDRESNIDRAKRFHRNFPALT